jgi:hypothetical protein
MCHHRVYLILSKVEGRTVQMRVFKMGGVRPPPARLDAGIG